MRKYENIEILNVIHVDAELFIKVYFSTEEDFIKYLRNEKISSVFCAIAEDDDDDIVDTEEEENKIRKLEDFYRFNINLYKDICRSEIEEARELREILVSTYRKMSHAEKNTEPTSTYYAVKGDLCCIYNENNGNEEENDADESLEALIQKYNNNINVLIKRMQDKLADYYKNNKSRINKEIEAIVLNDDFMELPSRTGRKSWFLQNVDDEVLLQYPFLTDTLNLIYDRHKKKYKNNNKG